MQLPSRSQVSHRKYYKLTRNWINQGRTTWAAPTGVFSRGRSRGRSVAWEWIWARGCAGALLPERSLMQRASDTNKRYTVGKVSPNALQTCTHFRSSYSVTRVIRQKVSNLTLNKTWKRFTNCLHDIHKITKYGSLNAQSLWIEHQNINSFPSDGSI